MSTKKLGTNKKSSRKTVKPTDDLNSLLDQKAALEQKIKEAEEKARNEIKVGDYLIITSLNGLLFGNFGIGQIYEVKDIKNLYYVVFYKGNEFPIESPNWNFRKYDDFYRKATESEIKEYKEKLAEEDLARRFEANKKDLETIKIGDYLIYVKEFANFANLSAVGANTLNKITGFAENGEVKLNGSEVSWIKSRFRRATQQEINEFELKNIKVGDWVYTLQSFGELGRGKYYKIESSVFGDYKLSNNVWILSSSINKNWRIASLEEVEKYQKEQEEKKNKEFKVDDYVVVLDASTGFIKDHIYKVRTFYGQNYGLDVYIDSVNSTENGWAKQYFRKATQEEVVKYQSKFEYKVEKDDYLINRDTGNFVKVFKEGSNSHYFSIGDYNEDLKSKFRLASAAEIESYLRAEAEQKGYKVGVKVEYWKSSSGIIQEIKFMENSKNFQSGAYTSSKNILYASWESSLGTNFAEIDDNLKIVKEECVEVNGYKAEYYKEYIQFGCAKISIDILYKLSMCFEFKGVGNRVLEGDIKIGAGTFNKQIIEKLLKIHEEKFEIQ